MLNPFFMTSNVAPMDFDIFFSICQTEVDGYMPDERTMFVGIQHPGERPDDTPGNPANPKEFSSWPDGAAGGRPRSSCIVITKDDGGKIGS